MPTTIEAAKMPSLAEVSSAVSDFASRRTVEHYGPTRTAIGAKAPGQEPPNVAAPAVPRAGTGARRPGAPRRLLPGVSLRRKRRRAKD